MYALNFHGGEDSSLGLLGCGLINCILLSLLYPLVFMFTTI